MFDGNIIVDFNPFDWSIRPTSRIWKDIRMKDWCTGEIIEIYEFTWLLFTYEKVVEED